MRPHGRGGTTGSKESWAFLVPIGNLWLTDAVGREFRVDRVTFVDKDRLPRARRRLGLGARVSEIRKTVPYDFFSSAKAFAVVRQTGTPEQVAPRCLEMVREEAAILTLSQLGYSNRGQMRPIIPEGEVGYPTLHYLAVSGRDGTRFANITRTAPLGEVVLSGRWKSYQDDVFYTKLLRILRKEIAVSKGWRGELRRAAVMVGESVGANDLLKSFVWNWTALETLLTKRGDRVGDRLPERVEALLGWVLYWEAEDYTGRIQRVYQKRNHILHDGRREGIGPADVAFTDHLLVNLLVNLVENPELFRSKSDVVRFSERLKAELRRGEVPSVRPANLRFIRRFRPEF